MPSKCLKSLQRRYTGKFENHCLRNSRQHPQEIMEIGFLPLVQCCNLSNANYIIKSTINDFNQSVGFICIKYARAKKAHLNIQLLHLLYQVCLEYHTEH